MENSHATCGVRKQVAGLSVICREAPGHTSSLVENVRKHYDPVYDERWSPSAQDEQTPLERATEDLVLFAVGTRSLTADALAPFITRLITEASADGKPSRFSGKPAEIDAWMRERFAEDTYLSYQRAIGDAVLDEIQTSGKTFRNAEEASHVPRVYLAGMDDVLEHVMDDRYFPASLVNFEQRECTVPHHTHHEGRVQLSTCRYED